MHVKEQGEATFDSPVVINWRTVSEHVIYTLREV